MLYIIGSKAWKKIGDSVEESMVTGSKLYGEIESLIGVIEIEKIIMLF